MIREGQVVGWENTRVLKDGRVWGADPLERFLAKIHITPCDCWEMNCGLDSNGYSYFKVKGKSYPSYRWLYEQLVGPIQSGLELDHLCRNRRCCNPDHLEPVTHKVNQLRGYSPAAQLARKQTCAKGHPFVTRMYKGVPYRRCLACQAEDQRRYRIQKIQAVLS